MKAALVSVTNDLATDNRVHRSCTVLVALGYEVLLVGRKLPASLPLERPYRTRRMRLLFNKGPLFYAEYNTRLFLFLLFSRSTLLLSNDLDTLLPNYLVARMRGKKLIYDTHEFYTEVPELVRRPRIRAVWLAIEQWIFPKLKTVITVNRSIAEQYHARYGNTVQVVRNIPMKRDLGPMPSREALQLPADKRILVMQGAGINVDRGAEEAVLAMRELPECLLLIIGGGDAWPVLEQLVKEHALQDRVRLLGKLPYERMMAYTRNADLGLTLDKDTNLNYRFSLPNKLFDYLHAGIPVLATDLPEVAGIVREFDCGVVLKQAEPGAIVQAVQQLLADPARISALRANATFAARKLDGEEETAKLRSILEHLG
ncbi:MAG: glycosyltransferase [Flavobacteriales bacterium]|nr:glycosyltransferase [Flavobacteriales bacterium]MBK6893632.1 glycosyltransferase [Flavobacteriales bacterium]MBK7248656.1 glycosyltransferase [Flavobacteriales bacterium]QQS73907.1 MAG: glycosyltransferase [Flavobacteriales bacterium]HQV38862.1 glycosyltransferase [Flavobacteriales bacterium]